MVVGGRATGDSASRLMGMPVGKRLPTMQKSTLQTLQTLCVMITSGRRLASFSESTEYRPLPVASAVLTWER